MFVWRFPPNTHYAGYEPKVSCMLDTLPLSSVPSPRSLERSIFSVRLGVTMVINQNSADFAREKCEQNDSETIEHIWV